MINDKFACADVVQSWGLFRDQGRWSDLLGTFWPEGIIAVSWFRGPFSGFVESCRGRDPARTGRSKHLLAPSVVWVNGARAIAETSATILVRQVMGGVLVDLTSNARFLDRLEQRDGAWKIIERNAIYERDRLDPVEPSAAFDEMMRVGDAARFAAPYRYMAFRLAAAGGSLSMPVHHDDLPETKELQARCQAWLGAAA